jgi:hypothetical protein
MSVAERDAAGGPVPPETVAEAVVRLLLAGRPGEVVELF